VPLPFDFYRQIHHARGRDQVAPVLIGHGAFNMSTNAETISHPTVSTFDAPSWEICQIKRGRTNTPLQSLALLNDVTYVEAARKLAERMITTGGETPESRIRFGFLLATLREPSEFELTTLREGYREYQSFYSENEDAAKGLLATGESAVDESLAADELAAMTSVASVLLNLDEVVTKE
jgi:hypothetical protein